MILTFLRLRDIPAAIIAASSLLLTSQASAQRTRQQTPPPPGWDAFAQLFDTAAARDSIVGGAVQVVRDGRVIAHHEYGYADRAQGKRITPASIFHYGSITKTLTAIGIMQLRDRGELKLDDRITSYIPELRQVHDPYGSMDSVTLTMLLSHSAGFQNPTWPYKQGKPWEPFEPTTWNQLVAMMPYQELLFKPGARFSYSNPGFIYLARVIEQLSHAAWESYVQKNIFSPLGLAHSYFGYTPYYLAADRSHNYTLARDSAGKEMVRDNGAEFDPGITIPNGGWNAPLGDLATYIAYLTDATHGDTATRRLYDVVLSQNSLHEMWNPRYPTAEDGTSTPSDSVGLSFFIVHQNGVRYVGHTGSQAGFLAFVYINPANKMGVVAAFNTDNELPGQDSEGRRSAFVHIRDAALKLLQ